MMAIMLPSNPKLAIKGIAVFFRKAIFSELRSLSGQLILNNSRLPFKVPFSLLSTSFPLTLKNPFLSFDELETLRIKLKKKKTDGSR